MELPRFLSIISHLNGESGDTTDEVITKPDLAALLGAEMPPDEEDYEFDVEMVTESELFFNMRKHHLTNIPAIICDQGVDSLVDEQQRKEEEENARLAEQYMADRQNGPKGTITKVKANDIERGLHADTVKTPARVAGTGRLDTPPTGPRNFRSPGLQRSPGTWKLNHYENGTKEYKPKETYGEQGHNAYTTNDVFSHLGEKRDAMREQRKLAKGEALSTIFAHGLRYIPMDPIKDQGFRTILIPVPEEMGLENLIRAKLMSRGQIYHIQKCDTLTIVSTGGTNTMKIIFVNQPDWIDDEAEMAKITVIPDKPAYKVNTKTWPMSQQMIRDISGGATRMIIIHDAPGFGSVTAEELQDGIRNWGGPGNPCHYKLGHQILLLDSDGVDKVAIVFNSITNAVNFIKWFQSRRRAFFDDTDVPELKWEFGLDISMTAAEVAHHEQLMEMRRVAQARIEPQDKTSATRHEANGASSSSASSSGTTPTENDDPQGAPVMTTHSILKDITSSSARYPRETTTEGFSEEGAGDLGAALQYDMEDCGFEGAMYSIYGGPRVATFGNLTSEQSKMQKDNGASARNKTTVTRDASSSDLYSGPRPYTYVPGNGFNFNPAAATFAPANKQFRFGTFPSAQGSFYPDGPSDEERGPLYRRAARQPHEEDEVPGFVYRDDTIGRPLTPFLKDQVPRMGLYQPKSGTNWADEDDEDDDFGLSDLSISSGCVPPPPTPVKGKALVRHTNPNLDARVDEGLSKERVGIPRSPRQFFNDRTALGPAPATPQNTGNQNQIPRPRADEFDFVSTQRAIFDSLSGNPAFRNALEPSMTGVSQPQPTRLEPLRQAGNGTSYSSERQAPPTAAPQPARHEPLRHARNGTSYSPERQAPPTAALQITGTQRRFGAPQFFSAEAAFAFGQYHPALAGRAQGTANRARPSTANLPRPSYAFSDPSTLVNDDVPQSPSRNHPMTHLHHTSLDANSQLPHAIGQGEFSGFDIDSRARPDLFPKRPADLSSDCSDCSTSCSSTIPGIQH